MGKMHELLAVEKDIVGRAAHILAETLQTFKSKAVEFYTARYKTYKPFADDDKNLLPTESKELVDTVPKKLEYTTGALAEEIDWLLQKELTNRKTSADLQVDGITFGTSLPATYLLALSGRLKKFRNLVMEAPTLPNGVAWIEAKDKGEGIWTSKEPITTYRTQKVFYPFVLSPATDRHPAQVNEKSKDETIGEFTEQIWDSRVTSSYKSELLERIDKLLLAIEVATRRANDVEAQPGSMGKSLFSYILNGKA